VFEEMALSILRLIAMVLEQAVALCLRGGLASVTSIFSYLVVSTIASFGFIGGVIMGYRSLMSAEPSNRAKICLYGKIQWCKDCD
jgi:hypothetical protein